jgi:hypothetical protein
MNPKYQEKFLIRGNDFMVFKGEMACFSAKTVFKKILLLVMIWFKFDVTSWKTIELIIGDDMFNYET